MDTSLYRIRSLGKAASNKELNSKTLEVTLDELYPMVDGEITANATTETVKGTDANGIKYQKESTSSVTVKATWRPIGDSFRQTPPDVRRGDPVLVYQFGDDEKQFYWETVGDDHHRRLETVRFGITATQDENASIDNTNSYLQEWSSHNKYVTLLSSSLANGEKVSYVFQFNMDSGAVVLQDSNGNFMLLDSVEKRWLFQNADGSLLDMDGKNITMTAPEKLTMNAKSATFNFTDSLDINTKTTTINGTTVNINANTNLLGNFDLKGDMTSGAGASGTTGQLTLAKNVTIMGDLDVRGRTHTHDLTADNPPW